MVLPLILIAVLPVLALARLESIFSQPNSSPAASSLKCRCEATFENLYSGASNTVRYGSLERSPDGQHFIADGVKVLRKSECPYQTSTSGGSGNVNPPTGQSSSATIQGLMSIFNNNRKLDEMDDLLLSDDFDSIWDTPIEQGRDLKSNFYHGGKGKV